MSTARMTFLGTCIWVILYGVGGAQVVSGHWSAGSENKSMFAPCLHSFKVSEMVLSAVQWLQYLWILLNRTPLY